MMPLTEIHRLKQTVSARWDSPVADEVAAAWGHPAGTARWWRSSASHVFVLPGEDGRRYLRFVPATCREPESVAAVAALMARLHADGSAVVRPVAAGSGRLTVTVGTGLGAMHAMVVEPAPGEEIEAGALTASRARSWGRALARLHADASGAGDGLPEAFGELGSVPGLFTEDAALVEAVAGLAARLDGLPRDGARRGVVHGDFELDNMAWEGDRAVAYDFDEAALSWYAADIAYALRDLTDATGLPAAGYRDRHDAFLAGYREVRPLDEEEAAHLPLFAGLHAAASLVRITRALPHPAEDVGELASLHADLLAMAASHRALVLAVARRMSGGA